ncbi:MAG TPA: AAA family ATPase, partial [Streptosporangiaceae bacterium]
MSAASQPGSGPVPRARRPRKGGRPAQLLAPEATVNFASERNASGISDVLAALDGELVGLAPVKKRIQEVAALLLVSRVRQNFGLLSTRPNLHMCFTGAPGVGKTTVGMRMAELLHRLGYLDQGHLVVAMRNDLVGEYIGHTAPKTKKVLDRAKGGVLFIDEAYYLHRTDSEKDYGQEAVEILLQVMENERDNLVVILAGYKNRMDAFFESNPGMSSRIAHHLDFADYELDELDSIGKLMLQQESYYLSEDAAATFREYLKRRMQQPRFANGRSVRNALERARLRHANRLLADPDRTWNRDDLMRIEPVDILASRVFSRPTESSDGQPGDPPAEPGPARLPLPRDLPLPGQAVVPRRLLPVVSAAMRILVLGGTSFVGRAIVEDALRSGAEVTLFGRGKTGADLFPELIRLIGDRDTGDYRALREGSWDAVVDVSGYVPRHVGQAMDALGGRAGRYLFISSHAVYQSTGLEPGSTEDTARRPPMRDTEELDDGTYGPLKVACEDDVAARYGSRATIVRPGKVAGPHDWQEGLTYWVRRAARGGRVALP